MKQSRGRGLPGLAWVAAAVLAASCAGKPDAGHEPAGKHAVERLPQTDDDLLTRYEMTSPIDGVVIAKHATRGERSSRRATPSRSPIRRRSGST